MVFVFYFCLFLVLVLLIFVFIIGVSCLQVHGAQFKFFPFPCSFCSLLFIFIPIIYFSFLPFFLVFPPSSYAHDSQFMFFTFNSSSLFPTPTLHPLPMLCSQFTIFSFSSYYSVLAFNLHS
jgi:hypothetical protein